MRFPLGWLLLDKWFWITVLGCVAVIVGPFMTVYIIVLSPVRLRAIIILGILVGWSAASGYKDWTKARGKEERPPPRINPNVQEVKGENLQIA